MNTASDHEADQFFNDFENSDMVVQPPEQSNEMERPLQLPFDQPIFSEDTIEMALLPDPVKKNSKQEGTRMGTRDSYEPGFGLFSSKTVLPLKSPEAVSAKHFNF